MMMKKDLMKLDGRHYRYVIIGAGPAGIQMGYFMEKAGADYIILEKSDTAGSFFATQPVHRKLISINKKYNFFPEAEFNWRHDWNSLLSDDPELRFTEYTDDLFPDADQLYRYFNDFANKFELNIAYGTTVGNIARQEGAQEGFIVRTESGDKISCSAVLLGLGAVSQRVPDEIEGLETATLYKDQTLDLEYYKNKRVAVIGGGNSAFETADYLAPSAAFVHIFLKEPPKMAWDTHFVGHIRAVNNNIFDLYQLKSMHAVLNPRIRRIELQEDGTYKTFHEYDYPDSSVPGTLKLTREYDIVINCTGWNWSAPGLFDESCQPRLSSNGKFPVLTSSWESINIPDLYYIGGAMQSIDRKSASGFIHGYRYNIRTLFHLLMEKFEKIEYPHEVLDPFDWDQFLDKMYERFSISPGLFQLFGFLCDTLILEDGNRKGTYYQELPRKYAESIIPVDKHALVFTLEFGFHNHNGSSLSFLGPSDPNNTKCAAFLHPVIRHYYNGETAEFHFGDSLLARWDRPHETGGAVVSYHRDFLIWIKDKLSLDITIPELNGARGAFEPWSDAEIEQYNQRISMKDSFPCS